MKPILIFAAMILVGQLSYSQKKEKEHKQHKENNNAKASNEKSNQEKIIWAGVGTDLTTASKDAKNVPPQIMSSYREHFPNTTVDGWRKYRGNWAVTFSNPTYTTVMVFHSNGDWKDARTVATDWLPLARMIDKVQADYSGYTIVQGNIVRIDLPDSTVIYRIPLVKDGQTSYVFYNIDGSKVEYSY